MNRYQSKVNQLLLGQDLLAAKQATGYDELFRVKMLSMEQLNPFRAYFFFQKEWWPVKIRVNTYPIVTKPEVEFEGRIPMCPQHPQSWHPNVFDNGRICWGDVKVFPEMRVVGLVNTLVGMLYNPNHMSAVNGHCGVMNVVADHVQERGRSLWQQLREAEKKYNSGQNPLDFLDNK